MRLLGRSALESVGMQIAQLLPAGFSSWDSLCLCCVISFINGLYASLLSA